VCLEGLSYCYALYKPNGDIHTKIYLFFFCVCLWFRASLICIHNCPTRCNTKQSIHYSASFGCKPHPSSRVHKTVSIAAGTGHIFCAATSLQRGQAWPRWKEVAGPVPETVVTVLFTPNDGCG